MLSVSLVRGSESRKSQVLKEVLDDMVPEAEDQLRVDGDELGSQ